MNGSGDNGAHAPPAASSEFTATHWSVVLAAAQQDSPQATEALEQLCRDYWCPMYAYIRRQGQAPEAAEDLTQEFFARLLAREYLSAVHPQEGRFRWFLLCAVSATLSCASEGKNWDAALNKPI